MQDGHFFALKKGISAYMAAFYAQVYTDTPALAFFKQRGIATAMVWAADRMIDAADDILRAYIKNNNEVESPVPANKNSLLPMMALAISKDYMPTTGDWGGRQVPRQLVKLTDAPDASAYGYRQAMGDIRFQVVIFAVDSPSARSLAAQFCLFVADPANRRFDSPFQFGQYEIDMPTMLETPDIMFSPVDVGRPNISVLAADLTLKTTFPYFDAPAEGEPNDGSNNNPKGYPMVDQVDLYHFPVRHHARVNADGIVHDNDMADKTDPSEG